MNKCGIILLAAGESKRLGIPKQLLLYKNQFLLQHCFETLAQLDEIQVITVYGANVNVIIPRVQSNNFHYAYNTKWQQGISSSMRRGLTALLNIQPDIEYVVFMVCDQPFITADLLKNIIAAGIEGDKGIVACAYDDCLGTPTLFSKKYFADLVALSGDTGAKNVIMDYRQDVCVIDFPMGKIDIDTRDDYSRLLKM